MGGSTQPFMIPFTLLMPNDRNRVRIPELRTQQTFSTLFPSSKTILFNRSHNSFESRMVLIAVRMRLAHDLMVQGTTSKPVRSRMLNNVHIGRASNGKETMRAHSPLFEVHAALWQLSALCYVLQHRQTTIRGGFHQDSWCGPRNC